MAVINGTNGVIAWANIYASNNTIRAHYNVSSLTNNGSGKQRLNLSTASVSNYYGILGTATAASGGNNYANRGQVVTSYEQAVTSSASQVPYAIEYAPNGGAGAISHVTITVVGSI
tara:strand:- start:110 stop:457 length:348 start_codon:yes stop_codon:yes gene_type:complete